MVIYDNEFKTKEGLNLTEEKNRLQQVQIPEDYRTLCRQILSIYKSNYRARFESTYDMFPVVYTTKNTTAVI